MPAQGALEITALSHQREFVVTPAIDELLNESDEDAIRAMRDRIQMPAVFVHDHSRRIRYLSYIR